jgi:hypothetical protein
VILIRWGVPTIRQGWKGILRPGWGSGTLKEVDHPIPQCRASLVRRNLKGHLSPSAKKIVVIVNNVVLVRQGTYETQKVKVKSMKLVSVGPIGDVVSGDKPACTKDIKRSLYPQDTCHSGTHGIVVLVGLL